MHRIIQELGGEPVDLFAGGVGAVNALVLVVDGQVLRMPVPVGAAGWPTSQVN